MRFHWRWAALAIVAAGVFQASTPQARASDSVECTFLMGADPAEMEYLPPELRRARCIERRRFDSFGHQYLIADVAGYDPAGAEYRTAVAQDAVMRAVNHFRQWFTVPEAIVIFGRMGSMRGLGERRINALGITQSSRFSCVIAVHDAALHQGRDEPEDRASLMHTIAHELFHCVQLTDPTIDNTFVKWRDEATAEFFSGRAIREAPYNNAYGRQIEQILESPLYEMQESAAPFIFYAGQRLGQEAIVEMMRHGGRGDSPAAQIQTLSRLPDVETLFHDFARAWVEGQLVDQVGRRISLPGPFTDITPIERAQTLTLQTTPFQITAPTYALAPGMAWEIGAPTDGDVRGVWRAETAWRELPAELDTCPDPGIGMLILTQASGDGEALYDRDIEVRERPDLIRNCQCPYGTWIASMDDLRAGPMGGMLDPAQLIDGHVSITFDRGQAHAEYNEVTFDARIDNVGSGIRSILRGRIDWTWRRLAWDERHAGPRPTGADVTDYFMIERTVTQATGSWTNEFWSRGARINERRTPWRPEHNAGHVSTTPAMCTGNQLRLLTNRRSGVPNMQPWEGVYTGARP